MNRKDYVGASEVAALFGLHNYITIRQLYHMKRGEAEVEENAAMKRGRILEPAIAQLWMEETGVALTPHQQQIPHSVIRLAATPDFIDEKGCPFEIKTTRFKASKGVAEAHLLQVAAQCMCLGVTKGRVLYYDMLADSFDLQDVYLSDAISNLITVAVDRFWSEYVDRGVPPQPVGDDVQMLSRMLSGTAGGDMLCLTGDNLLAAAISDWLRAKEDRKSAEKREADAKVIIMDKINGASGIVCGEHRIKKSVISVKEKLIKAHKQVRLNYSTEA